MSGIPFKTCFVVLMVALSVQYSQEAQLQLDSTAANCTTDADCTEPHFRCRRFDQCQKGWCVCEDGYVTNTTNACVPWKKIGEDCDGVGDACYGDAECEAGKCTCTNGKEASNDKMTCGHVNGEGCSKDDDCDNGDNALSCQDDKCGCSSEMQYYTWIKMPFRRSVGLCGNKQWNVNVQVNGECDPSSKFCAAGLTCYACPGGDAQNTICLSVGGSVSGPNEGTTGVTSGPNEGTTGVTPGPNEGTNGVTTESPDNSTGSSCDTCMKGANQLSVVILAVCGLLVNAFLTEFL